MSLSKRISRVEVKAAPLIKRVVETEEQRQLEEYHEEIRQAHYWRYIGHFYPDVAEAARVALEPIGHGEEIDLNRMTPDGRIAWAAFQALGDSIPIEELNRYQRAWFAEEVLNIDPMSSLETINAELQKRGGDILEIGGSHITGILW